ncbi:MAG TPA: glycoside hydrolase family 47 protein [Pyrinomonadaceae bacterium]|nr:glycoside hydrolase family 47 protein [Pyrinomonadaceae bacterium]
MSIFSKINLCLFMLLIAAHVSFGQRPERMDKTKEAARVKTEFLHAWNGYKKYCWGHDDLKPLSKTCRDWYGTALLMTPVDSLDTMYLMSFKTEADRTREYIIKNLSFDKDISVQNFEITIRILGGLLSSYQITGDKRLLNLAEDLGTRLLPVFNSPTGMPYKFVNLKTGAVKGEVSNPAETGTLLIEYGTLSKLTNKPIFFEKAKRALVETYKRRSPLGLVGRAINIETGKWTNTDSYVGSEIDSYYEYLLKCAILFDDADCWRMWRESIAAINKYLADERRGGLWYGHVDMNIGKRTATTYGALDAFFPAILALSGDLTRAERLQNSGFRMWKIHAVEPEEIDYVTMKVTDAGYPLRPEIVESTYYLYHYTKDPKYLTMGKTMFDDLVKYCRTDDAYAGLKSVVTKEKTDYMHSFLFAETFKYFYLLFAPEKTLDFNKVVFNTEAHPIKRL